MNKTIQKVNVKNAYAKRLEILNKVETAKKSVVHVSKGNSKMGVIPSFSVLPIITCKNCSECSKYCYACKGCFNFPSNIKNLAENTELLKNDLARVEKEINAFLDGGVTLYRYFRWNVSGDVYSVEYLEMIIRIAKKNKNTRFLFFTKNYELMNEYFLNNKKPSNLTIVFSQWSNAKIENPLKFPVAIVNIENETIIPRNSFHCNGDCVNCLECWHARKNTNRYFNLH